MITEHLTLMWRKATKNKVFTLINIFGLSVGIAVFILIMLWVQSEFSYDKFNRNIDNIYRIEIGGSAYMVSAIGQAFANEFPEIVKFVRFRGMGSTLLTYETESLLLENAFMADSTLFDIFTYEFLYGNPREALVTPFSIVLTETTARTLFGDMDPVGKGVKTGNGVEATITGVIKDVGRTHMPVDAIISFVTLGKVMPQSDYLYSFGTSQFATYFLISEGVDIGKLAERMTDFTDEIYVKHGRTAGGHENELVPLKDIYFHDVHCQSHLHGNLKFVYIFLLVSILTLVIACINFINLTIAKSSTVVREVGVKKVFGASQKQLFTQFLFESIILCYISSLIAIIIIRIILPEFNHLTGGHITLDAYVTASYIIIYFLIVALIGFLAGIYPAIRLSSFNPIQYLHKFGDRGISKSPFRTALVIFQFTISFILTLSLFVVIRQLNFMKEYKTGFNSENIILMRMVGDINNKRDAFKNEIMSIPNIQEMAFTDTPPGTVNNYEGFAYQGVEAGFPVFTVDPSFLPMLGVKINEGRNFDWERPNDRLGVCILNREAVELFGMKNAVGSFLKHQYYLTTIPQNDIEIIGVIDDYHYVSPKDSVGPALFCYGNWYSTACLKVNPENLPVVLKQIEAVWNKFAQGFPFEYHYLDEYYGRQYKSESTLSRILVYFAFVAILIACLGLLGLASFLAQEKTREIGVRKVFGATSTLIVRLLSTNFLKWVIVAIIIGSPLAVIIMNKWLMNFAYHTTVSWWLIVLAAIILLSVSLFTILFHIIRVSGKNPVYALKYE
jgi:putative ABC transport system permease protein